MDENRCSKIGAALLYCDLLKFVASVSARDAIDPRALALPPLVRLTSFRAVISIRRISGRGRPITLAFRQLHAAIDAEEARRYWQGYLRLKTGEAWGVEETWEGGERGDRYRFRSR